MHIRYSEYKSSNPGNENSWYYNILFFSDKLGLDLSIGRNLSKGKFKSLLKKCIQKDFINTWSKIKLSYSQDQGKLNIYFKFKTTFQYENYLDLKNQEKKKIVTRFRIRDRPFNLQGGGGRVMVFCFVQNFFFRTTRELEYLFFRLYDKNSESDYFFFLHQNQNIFFSNIGNQNIFLEKNHNPPFKLSGRSLTSYLLIEVSIW